MEEVQLPHGTKDAARPADGQAGNERPCSLGELIDEHCAALQQEKPANEATQLRYREYLVTILQLMGDRDIREYAHKDLLTLKSQLLRWPVNAGKAQEFRDKTAAEILRMKVAKPLDKRVVDTKYMEKIVAVFRYAFRTGRISSDITLNLTPSLAVSQQRAAKRKIYNAADLNKIFATLPFHPDRPYLAWLPLIAAYSGALPGEICRLRVSDINVDHVIPYMVITGEDDNGNTIRNLRDEESRRLVPLHPVLVEMGFLRFVARRKAAGRELLFEKRRQGGEDYEPLTGAYYGQSFESFNRRFITKDLRKAFDSFRRNVQHELQLKNVSTELCHAITGLVPQYDDVAGAAAEQLLADKYSALAQLRYPGLDLQALKERFSGFEQKQWNAEKSKNADQNGSDML